jgi:hypothetical protein
MRTKSFFRYLTLLCLGAALLLGVFFSQQWLQARPYADAGLHTVETGRFQIKGNKILDPGGHLFVVRGIDAIYGTFGGGDQRGYGAYNFQHATRDLAHLKAAGIDLIRIDVSPRQFTSENQQSQLDAAIQDVTNLGLVAMIDNNDWNDPTAETQWLQAEANRYQSNPFVWFNTGNEPFCGGINCNNWRYWQTIEKQWVQAIRAGGNNNPIVINCIHWSWDCSQIAQYPLGDTNLIYGAHRYANGHTSFDTSEQQAADEMWANLATQFPIIVDEVGAKYNPDTQLGWNRGFMSYLVNWVKTRQGDGVIGFVYRWSDANSMLDRQGNLNLWGHIFFDDLIKPLNSSKG